MYVETYREKELAVGAVGSAIPWPKMGEREARAWRRYLPVTLSGVAVQHILRSGWSSHRFGNRRGFRVVVASEATHPPPQALEQLREAWRSKIFDEVQIWARKHTDPMAVGIRGGKFHKIARWGSEELLTLGQVRLRNFEAIAGPILASACLLGGVYLMATAVFG